MDLDFVDHYLVLGLPTGEAGTRLLEKEITKAYKSKALLLHPDKRPNDDPAAAHSDFQKLRESYLILSDVKARHQFDTLLLSRCCRRRLRQQPRSEEDVKSDPKRQKMMADLQARERRCSGHADTSEEDVESRIAEKLKREIAKIREMMSAAKTPPLDRARVLKVFWEDSRNSNSCGGYTADRLRKLFEKFGEVEDVLVSQKKNRKGGGGCSALVVMAYKVSAVAAYWSMVGDMSNPLKVQLLASSPPPPPPPPANRSSQFEESVIAKLKQAANRQKGEMVV